MFIREVQNKNALQRTLMSHRTMTESAQWPVGAVITRCRHTELSANRDYLQYF